MVRKIFLVSMAGLLGFGLQAQTISGSVGGATFGITGGVVWSTINGKNSMGATLENKLKTGFTGGLNVELPVGGGFYLQPGAEYRMKGAKLTNGDKLTLSYIDVPVNLLYKPMLGNGSILLGAGPYVGFGMDGKVESPNGTDRDVIFSNTWSATEAPDLQFKKLDAGANVMAGYEFRSRLSAALKAQLGLVNIYPDTTIPNDQTSYKNTNFGFSLGYRF